MTHHPYRKRKQGIPEAELFNATTHRLNTEQQPPASTLLLVHYASREFVNATRTVADWLEDDEALPDLVACLEAGITRRRLHARLSRYGRTEPLDGHEIEQVALDELAMFIRNVENTWGAMLNKLELMDGAARLSTLDLLQIGLLNADDE